MTPARPISAEARKHPRAQLSLPVRVRWYGPFGMSLETTRTIDVSREGLLVKCADSRAAGMRAWVIFPFNSLETTIAQPEMPARVIRFSRGPSGPGFAVAIHLEGAPHPSAALAGHERRTAPRVAFAFPIFVRGAGAPWPIESMTDDISHTGARFETFHVYAPGQRVRATIPWNEWVRNGEMAGRVIRVQPVEDGPQFGNRSDLAAGITAGLTSVAVQWDSATHDR